MSIALSVNYAELYGLYEIDQAGMIRYCRIRKNNSLFNTKPLLVGHNIFQEILPFDNVGEFKEKFDKFCRANSPTENFLFDCKFQDKVLQITVLFVRLSQSEFFGNSRLFIIDIRKSTY